MDTEAERPLSESSPTNSYLGLLLKDRYLVERVIGQGGIGVVYLARDQKLVKRPVVIKVLHDLHASSDLGSWYKKKFQHEIEALSRIDHPGVVGVLDAGEMPDGRAYFVMQYVEGVTLRSALNEQGMDLNRIGSLVKQMGQALNAAHEKGILHRDLKPENIMIQNLGGGDEQVKLIDFGIARVADPQIAPETQATRVAGTPPYMAPEQIRGRPTAASDVYSLGAIAYEMVTGLAPFKADTQVGLYEMQREGVKVKPREVRPSLPAAAEEAILKALSFDENERFSRARYFGDELARTLSGAQEEIRADRFATSAGPGVPATLATSDGKARPTVPDGQTRIDGQKKKPAVPVMWIVIAALLIAAVSLVALMFRSARQSQVSSGPQRSLDYWVMVQKFRDGNPFEAPFKLPGDILFEKDYRIQFFFSSEQSGFLYIINEGPRPINNLPAFVILFPKPSINDGSAAVAAGQQISTPQFSFDEEQGAERLWLVWTAESAPELEAVKGVVNPTDRGAITNSDQIFMVRDYLDKHYAGAKAAVKKDEASKQMSVKIPGEVLVHLVKLEHH